MSAKRKSDLECCHISDREAMLSILNDLIMIYASVAKTSAHYRGKLVFLPAASDIKGAQY